MFDFSSIYNLFAIFSVETLFIAQGNTMGYGAVALSGRDNLHRQTFAIKGDKSLVIAIEIDVTCLKWGGN